MTKTFNTKIGDRDIQLLTAIDRCPLTPAQLCKLSKTFEAPFNDEANLRRRLRKLAALKFIQAFPYAMISYGRSPSYYKLTPDGYRFLYGKGVPLPKRRQFRAVSPGHHHHTFCLAETIVHIFATAKENNCEITYFARENSVRLEADPFTLYPDSAFVVKRSDGRTFPFVVELDNGSERVRSRQDVESIERKLRGYDAHQSKYDKFDPDRYLVLFITTRSAKRLQYILEVAGKLMSKPNRRVFVGVELNRLLSVDPFQVPIFVDHRGLKRQMVPTVEADSGIKTMKNHTNLLRPLAV